MRQSDRSWGEPKSGHRGSLCMDDARDVTCDRCAKVVDKDSPAWVELPSGSLRIAVLRDLDEALPFKRVWHARCLAT